MEYYLEIKEPSSYKKTWKNLKCLFLSKKKPIWLVFRGAGWMWGKGGNFYL